MYEEGRNGSAEGTKIYSILAMTCAVAAFAAAADYMAAAMIAAAAGILCGVLCLVHEEAWPFFSVLAIFLCLAGVCFSAVHVKITSQEALQEKESQIAELTEKNSTLTSEKEAAEQELAEVRASAESVQVTLETLQAQMAAQEEQKAEEEAKSAETGDTTSSDGVSPTFKELMDNLVAFYDDSVTFMEEYANTDSSTEDYEAYAGLLTKYAEWVEKYVKMEDEINSIGEDSLGAADYAYYLESLAKIEKRLAEVESQ